MSLKFFADHCVSNSIINALLEAGYEVWRLKDYLPTDSPDSIVISKAQELNTVLISLNGDFADIVLYPPSNYKGIISLQVRNHPEITPQLMSRLTDFLKLHKNMDYYSGKLFLVEVHRIRIRL
jgi:predicted nuclease of predicted toxin-antitoxin system